MKSFVWGLTVLILITACSMKERVDLIILDAKIYTVDNNFSVVSAVAVKDGIIVATGSDSEISQQYKSNNILNMERAPLYPGFNDAHAHVRSLGLGLQNVDLRGATSFEEVLERLQAQYDETNPTYLVGDGWDQTLWPGGDYPSNRQLSQLFPNIPVVLNRIDFHAIIVNDFAIDSLGISPGDSSIPKGEAIMEDGKFKGIFLENTAERFQDVLPNPTPQEYKRMLLAAQEECFKNGLTSVTDGGEEVEVLEIFEELNKKGEYKIRTDIWLTPTEVTLEKYPKPFSTGSLRVATVKLYVDGALGSRGALMTEPYSDMPSTKGISVITQENFDKMCQWAYDRGFQVATHCIGDEANRIALNTYAKFLEEGNDRRWRIEHAQIIHPQDLHLFKKHSIVPSIQPTHATSDMLWAVDRVGERIKNAYIFKELLDQLGWIPSGTDFPIEYVSPIYTFFAAVERKNLDLIPSEGFQMENALTREEALKSITIWPAKVTFEEHLKGSIEPGKYADFVVLDKDIMTIEGDELPKVKVNMTFLNGELVYSN